MIRRTLLQPSFSKSDFSNRATCTPWLLAGRKAILSISKSFFFSGARPLIRFLFTGKLPRAMSQLGGRTTILKSYPRIFACS
jgi:hypothetical protein